MFNAIKDIKSLYDSDSVENFYELFLPIKTFLTFIGFWPSAKQIWPYSIHTWLVILFVLLPFPLGQMYFVYVRLDHGNFIDLIASNLLIMETCAALFKGYYMKYNIFKIQDLFKEMNKNKLFKPKSKQQVLIVKNVRKKIYKFCLTFYIFGGFALICIYLAPIIFSIPLEVDFPFIQVSITPYYQLIHLWRMCYLIFAATIITSYDLLAASIMLFIGCQIDLLANELNNLNMKNDETTEDILHHNLDEIYGNFYNCIKKHQSILV